MRGKMIYYHMYAKIIVNNTYGKSLTAITYIVRMTIEMLRLFFFSHFRFISHYRVLKSLFILWQISHKVVVYLLQLRETLYDVI